MIKIHYNNIVMNNMHILTTNDEEIMALSHINNKYSENVWLSKVPDILEKGDYILQIEFNGTIYKLPFECIEDDDMMMMN